MADGSKDKRTQMLEVIWEHYLRCDGTASRRKKRTVIVSAVVIVAGFLGLVAATTSERLDDDRCRQAFAIGSAALIALSTFLGAELLGGDREKRWVSYRTLADALKRLVWLGIMRVPPFDGDPDAASQALDQRSEQLVENVSLTGKDLLGKPSSKEFPKAEGIDGYLKLRVDDQIGWYESRSLKFGSRHRFWRGLAIALGVSAALLGVLGGFLKNLGLPAWVPVVTTAVATIGSFLEAKRYLEIAKIYQDTAHRLRKARIRCSGTDLVTECERIMAEENRSWQAELAAEAADDDAV